MHARRTHIANAEQVLPSMAEATAGFSGAELANLVNEAAIAAVRESRDQATLDDFASSLEQYKRSRAPAEPYGGGGGGGVGGGGGGATAGDVLSAWLQQAVRVSEGGGGGASVAAHGIEDNE